MGPPEGTGRRNPVPRQRRRQRRHRRAAAGEREGLAIYIHQLSQHRLEADAALAGERGGLAYRALAVIGAGKANADFMAAEQRPVTLGLRVLAVDEFALPFAVRRGVGPDIVEIRVAAPDAAIVQQHHAAVARIDAVEHADVDRIEAVADSVCTNRPGRRRIRVVDLAQDGLEPEARQVRAAALEVNFVPLARAGVMQRDVVDVEHRDIAGVVVVARHEAFGGDDAVGLLEIAHE